MYSWTCIEVSVAMVLRGSFWLVTVWVMATCSGSLCDAGGRVRICVPPSKGGWTAITCANSTAKQEQHQDGTLSMSVSQEEESRVEESRGEERKGREGREEKKRGEERRGEERRGEERRERKGREGKRREEKRREEKRREEKRREEKRREGRRGAQRSA